MTYIVAAGLPEQHSTHQHVLINPFSYLPGTTGRITVPAVKPRSAGSLCYARTDAHTHTQASPP